MPKTVEITPTSIKLEEIYIFFSEQFDITLGEGAKKAINDCREYLEGKLSGSDELVYGINTGFGSLCNVGISNEQTAELQYNLIVSHACGQGEVVPEDIARLILLLKIKNMFKTPTLSDVCLKSMEHQKMPLATLQVWF